MTIWKAKGLEFPVVCVPSLWWRSSRDLTLYATGEGVGGADAVGPKRVRWVLDVAGGKDWPDEAGAAARLDAAAAERRGEELRLLYVALTRARHLTAVWWANLPNSEESALAHFLFARTGAELDRDHVRRPRGADSRGR